MTKKQPLQSTDIQPEQLPDGSITLTFTIPAAIVESGYQEVVKEYAASAELKGFRKGKAPIKLVEQSLDKSKIYSHVLEHVVPPAYNAVLQEHNFQPIIDPRLTPLSMEEGKDWSFKAETAGRPSIKLGDYRKYVAEALQKAPKTEPTKEEEEHNHGDDPRLTMALDSLLKNAEIAVAPLLIEEESKSALSKLVNQLAALKLSVDDYAKSIKKTREELVEEYKKTAETNLKVEFLLSEVVKDLKPKVEEAKDPYKKYALERHAALDFLSGL